MPVLPLSSSDVHLGVRRIGQSRCHKFTGCNHSVQQDGCMYPPRHTEHEIIQNSREDTIVRYLGLCSDCEYRKLIPQSIIDEVKKNIADSLADHMEPKQDIEMKRKARWSTNKLTLKLRYRERDRNNGEMDAWAPCNVLVYPELTDVEVKGARQWERVFLTIDKPGIGTEIKFVTLNVQAKIAQYEQKWNEPVVDSSHFPKLDQEPEYQTYGGRIAGDFATVEDFLKYGDEEMHDSKLKIAL